MFVYSFGLDFCCEAFVVRKMSVGLSTFKYSLNSRRGLRGV